MAETLRLALFAMLMAGGLIFEISAVFGANRRGWGIRWDCC